MKRAKWVVFKKLEAVAALIVFIAKHGKTLAVQLLNLVLCNLHNYTLVQEFLLIFDNVKKMRLAQTKTCNVIIAKSN